MLMEVFVEAMFFCRGSGVWGAVERKNRLRVFNYLSLPNHVSLLTHPSLPATKMN